MRQPDPFEVALWLLTITVVCAMLAPILMFWPQDW